MTFEHFLLMGDKIQLYERNWPTKEDLEQKLHPRAQTDRQPMDIAIYRLNQPIGPIQCLSVQKW